MREKVYQVVFLLVALAVIVAGEVLPPMPAVQGWQEAHPEAEKVLIIITAAMTALGVFFLAFTQFLVRVPDPRRYQGEQVTVTKGTAKGRGWFFSGMMASAGFSDQARMWRVRKAFRDGEWWSVPRWRRMSLMMLGAVLLFYGLFGLIFLLFPPGVKLLVALAVGYGTVRTVYEFAMDKPFREGGKTIHE